MRAVFAPPIRVILDPHESFVKGISRRIDDLLGLDPAIGEAVQGQRYLPGQQFQPHK